MIATSIPPGISPHPYTQRSVSGRDLISIQDFTPQELACALELAAAMKARPPDYRGTLVGKQIVLFFEKPSLRTRLTFEAGINSLGGVSFFVDQTQSRLGARESLSDVAHNLERWVDGVVLRTFSHETVTHGHARIHPGDQRPERIGASLPGIGRYANATGTLR
jgi:ornithine carbamoyltransferase